MTIEVDSLPDYAVCTPYWGALDVEHHDCKAWLRRAMPTIRQYRITGCAYIDMARSALVRLVELGGHRGLVFVDHDILFQPADVAGLITAAEETGAVVSGVYCMRKSGDRLIGGFGAWRDGSPVQRATFFDGGGLYPAAYSGLGFTAIPWRVIERVVEHFGMRRIGLPIAESKGDQDTGAVDRGWPLFALDTSGDYYMGEDVSFCARVKAAGCDVLLDTRAKLYHKGSYRYGIEDANVVVPRASRLDVELCRQAPPLVAADAEKYEGLSEPSAVQLPPHRRII